MKRIILYILLFGLTGSLIFTTNNRIKKDTMYYSDAKWVNEKYMMLTRFYLKIYKNGKFKYVHTIEVKDTNVKEMYSKIDYLIPRVFTGKYTIKDSVFIGKCNDYLKCDGKKRCDYTCEYRIDFKKKPLFIKMIGYTKGKYFSDGYVFIKEFSK